MKNNPRREQVSDHGDNVVTKVTQKTTLKSVLWAKLREDKTTNALYLQRAGSSK